ncbi:hypothetical protein CERSUDRAFT_89638 [Gelatoporia subvermispora B]|uniref:Uncharacterized protein n=1 Tax=Ceriporiopsis subvermispora (strain B) TaxID=914234 RepID=M2QFU2_CERS8|nr:hypothetical protein CERSUDRAFT_89638 [Gelatoporia subvermispora B]
MSSTADAPASPSSSDIQINVKGPNELKLQITISTDKTVAELKQAIADKSDVPADRQRLIYSGRVLKDEDALATYKIQSSHTIHMVKGAARSATASTQPAAAQPLPTMQAGQNIHDPLTQLNSHMGYGLMAGLNPFADMGLNPNDPNMMQSMLNSPQFLQQMSSVMSNPAVLDQLIASNPQLAAMGPQVRQVFQSERFRQMMSNPETLRMMLQMSSMMRESGVAPGMGGFGGAGGAGAFPAPGLPSHARQAQGQDAQSPPALGAPPAGAGALPNPFGAFFPPPLGAAPSASPASPTGTPGAAGAQPGATPDPLGGMGMFNPALMQQMLSMWGAGGAGAGAAGGADPLGLGAFGGLGGLGSPPAPTNTRPPEERFEVQLQQLQDMGFTNASQNIRALLATGGNVHSAIEYILNGGGL